VQENRCKIKVVVGLRAYFYKDKKSQAHRPGATILIKRQSYLSAILIKKERAIMNVNALTENFAVCGQIQAQDAQTLADQGYAGVVNNRPDLEEANQPLSETIQAACNAAGLNYIHLPMNGPSYSPEQVAQLQNFLKENDKILGFCRSGNRASILFNAAH
jgi:uncharacterized protein (TIGR01244 family)